MKSLLTQARAACANEVRKRDRQIDGLKKALSDAGRVRGGNKNRDVLSISVTGEVGGDERGLPAGATQDEGYSLRLETNEFLTQLARGLSEENEGLLALVRRTVDSLRDMSGMERGAESVNEAGAGAGAGAGHHQDGGNGEVQVMAAQKSAEELAAELEAIMEHLRTILTNPSFVPIEEVEVREEAINRLRAGLETMESRWKDAVHMIDGWRKRMVSSGKSVDMEDLQMGLRLSPVRVRDVAETSGVVPIPMRLSGIQEEEEEDDHKYKMEAHEQEQHKPEPQRPRSPSPVESLHLVPAPGYEAEENDDLDSDSSSIFQDDIDIEELEAEEPNVQVLQESTYGASIDSSPMPIPPKISPLKNTPSSGNRGVVKHGGDYTYRKRPGDFTTIVEENTWDLAVEEEERAPTPPPHVIKLDSSPKREKKTAPTQTKQSPEWQDQQNRPSSTASYDSPLFGRSGERPSQSDPTRKLFSKPTSSPVQQVQTKSQPEPGSKTQATRTKRPATSRESPDPLASDIKRTNSDPGKRPSRHQNPSTGRSKTPTSVVQSQSRPTSSSSLRQVITTTNALQQQQGQQPPPSPGLRSPTRTVNQTSTTTITTTSSRLPRPNSNAPPQSPLTMATIAAKLAASEREADAARVRAKLRAVRSGAQKRTNTTTTRLAPSPMPATAPSSSSPTEGAETKAQVKREEENMYASVDPVKRDLPPPQDPASVPVPGEKADDELAGSINGVLQPPSDNITYSKRRRDRTERRTSKVASRRRSTLSPWELETLIQGNPAAE